MTESRLASLIKRVDRWDASALFGLGICFLAIVREFSWFTIDDAYITLRYSKHLAEGAGVVYNLGTDPVEGYTSTLWVLVGAVPHAVGLSPIATVKTLGVVSALLAVGVLYGYARRRNVPRWLALVGCAQIAVSPAVAVLAVQGMETATAMLLVLVATVGSIELVRSYRVRWAVATNLALLLAMFARPGLVVFGVAIEAGLAAVLVARGRSGDLRRLVGWGFALVCVPGVLYMVGRVAYFGYPLPNPFYVKEGGLVSLRGTVQTLQFVVLLVGPTLFLALSATTVATFGVDDNKLAATALPVVVLLAFWHAVRPFGELSWNDPTPAYLTTASLVGIVAVTPALMSTLGESEARRRTAEQVAPATLAVVAFLSIWPFLTPLQGYLWRFQAPVLAAGTLVFVLLLRSVELPAVETELDLASGVRALVALSLLTGLVAHPLFAVGLAGQETTQRPPGDRVVMGKALGTVDGTHRMFVTESGALPYYSEWTAVDEWGLNSEEIAHEGMSAEYVREYDPHLVQLVVTGGPRPIRQKSAELAAFLDDNSYTLVAAVYRQQSDGTLAPGNRRHLYFVEEGAEEHPEVACTLLTQDLRYANRSRVVAQASIDVRAANVTAADC